MNFLVNKKLLCLQDKQNNTWLPVEKFHIYLRAPLCNSLFIFAGVNMVKALLTITSARAASIFMPKNIDLITIIIILEGIDKIKAKK